MVGYYDIVLGLIPVALFGITGVLYGVGLTITTAVVLAAIVAIALISHAMFVNSPTGSLYRESSTPTVTENQALAD